MRLAFRHTVLLIFSVSFLSVPQHPNVSNEHDVLKSNEDNRCIQGFQEYQPPTVTKILHHHPHHLMMLNIVADPTIQFWQTILKRFKEV